MTAIYRYDACNKCHRMTIKLRGEGHKLGNIYAWYCPKCKIYFIHNKLPLNEVRLDNLHIEYKNSFKENGNDKPLITKEMIQRQMGFVV